MDASGFGAKAWLTKRNKESVGLVRCSVLRNQSMIIPNRWEADNVNFVFFMMGALPAARKFTSTFRPGGTPRREETGAAAGAAATAAAVGAAAAAAAFAAEAIA